MKPVRLIKTWRKNIQILPAIFIIEAGWDALLRVKETSRVRPFPAECVDTTGAGDLFAAGALYGLTHDHSLEECAILGNYCGSRIVSQFGARLPQALDGRIDEIFSEYHSAGR